MEELIKRISDDGKAIEGGIIKVDNFLNHQIDARFMYRIGEEFIRLFSDVEYNKIVTIEASGIAPAVMIGLITGKPVVFAKKNSVNATLKDVYSSEIFSFSKKETKTVTISRRYLSKGDKILFIDDFLAKGEAALGIRNIISFAEAEVVGMGFVIEKSFQSGSTILRDLGIKIESLAIVESVEEGVFRFKE